MSKRSLYFATYTAGQGITHIWQEQSKAHLTLYAFEVLVGTDEDISPDDTIDDILDKLADHGPGYGSRRHRRVSRLDAWKYIREGAQEAGVIHW